MNKDEKFVYLLRKNDAYLTKPNYAPGPIATAAIFTSEDAACKWFYRSGMYEVESVKFKLVEVKPTVRITLTSKGTDEVWIKVLNLKKPLYRETLSELLLQDIEEAQGIARKNKDYKSKRSGGLARLRAILQHALYQCETHDIILGGVLLGHLEYEVIE